jgi:hypothetical protein
MANGVFVKVISAFVLTGRGLDKIDLKLDLPNAITYDGTEPNAHATVMATYGKGAEWVRENFSIESEIVHLTSI